MPPSPPRRPVTADSNMPGIVPPMKVITVGPQQSRVAQACDRCRSKKIKCDGITPCCSQCASAEFECRTSDKLSRRAFPRGYTESLEERVRALEAELRELKGVLDKKEHIISVLVKTNPTTSSSLTHMGPPPLPMPSLASTQSEKEFETNQAAEIASGLESSPSPLESIQSPVWTTTRGDSAGRASVGSGDPRLMTRKRPRSPETEGTNTSTETPREEKISRLDLSSGMSKSSQSSQRASMRRARTSTTPYPHEGQPTLETIPFEGPRRRRTTPCLSPVPSNNTLLNLDHQSFFSVSQDPDSSLESSHGSHGNDLDYFPFPGEMPSLDHTDWMRMMGPTQTAHTPLVASASTSEAAMLTPTTTSSSITTRKSFESSDIPKPAFYAETLDRPTSEPWAYSTSGPAITPFDLNLQPRSRQQLPSGARALQKK